MLSTCRIFRVSQVLCAPSARVRATWDRNRIKILKTKPPSRLLAEIGSVGLLFSTIKSQVPLRRSRSETSKPSCIYCTLRDRRARSACRSSFRHLFLRRKRAGNYRTERDRRARSACRSSFPHWPPNRQHAGNYRSAQDRRARSACRSIFPHRFPNRKHAGIIVLNEIGVLDRRADLAFHIGFPIADMPVITIARDRKEPGAATIWGPCRS